MHSLTGTAIVIIDAQKDFADPAFAYGSRHPVQQEITTVAERLKLLVQPAMPLPVLAVHSDYYPDQFGEGLSICIPGTGGHQSILPANPQLTRFTKKDHSCFSSEAFTGYLIQQQLKHLLLCGFLTEYCVKETALDALLKGYSVTICPALTGSADDKQPVKQQTLALLKTAGVQIGCPDYLNLVTLHA